MLNIEQFNNLDSNSAEALLQQCCASVRWGKHLIHSRPFTSIDALLKESQQYWHTLDNDDYLEAFAAHPMIGDLASLQAKYANTAKVAADEQASTQSASQETLQALQQLNHDYLDKHGFIFIICATGKSAQEMLAALQSRISNSTEVEINNAATEQLKITHLRLQKRFPVESL